MPVDPGRFTIRGYTPGDETAILELFARSFHQPRTAEHWQWKFQRNPYDRERISLAFDRDRLVGHYAGYPMRFVIDGSEIEGNHIGDTMTDPSVRLIGRGPTSVLGRTSLHFYEHYCEDRVAFNYGFNAANIQKFTLRVLRGVRVEPVAYRIRDLKRAPLRPLGRLERRALGVTLEVAASVSSEWDGLFNRVWRQYGFLSRRDATYVRWRYLESPDPRYTTVALRKWGRLVGWLVLRMRDGRMTIGDLLLDPDHAELFDLALRHLASVFPAGAVEMWCPSRPAWLHERLAESHLELQPEPQDLSLVVVPFVKRDTVETMRDRLYYTIGDSDLF